MKITPAAARIAILAVVFLGLLQSRASAANNPIPGVDIIVQKKPGGQAMRATTDKEGKFVFASLAAGDYWLVVQQSQAKAAVNTTRSNITRPSLRLEKGVEVVSVDIALGTDLPVLADIEISRDGGRVTGTVTSAGATGNGRSRD